MAATYTLIGFSAYIIINKILYRKPYATKSRACKLLYRSLRAIKRTVKNEVEGYYLTRNKRTAFYPLSKLKHRLKKQV